LVDEGDRPIDDCRLGQTPDGGEIWQDSGEVEKATVEVMNEQP
jgi:hypothetical protein